VTNAMAHIHEKPLDKQSFVRQSFVRQSFVRQSFVRQSFVDGADHGTEFPLSRVAYTPALTQDRASCPRILRQTHSNEWLSRISTPYRRQWHVFAS
jgi:hypothetical protein